MCSLKNRSQIALISFLPLFFYACVAFAGDASVGKEKAMLCVGCHGANGISISPEVPNLAGQKKVYLINTIKDFRSEIRKNPIMNAMVKTLSDEDIESLASYFSSLKVKEK